jgi:hypothetical protein
VTNELKSAVNQLVKPQREKKRLPPSQPVPPIGPGVGFAQPQPAASSGNGGGIVSPRVEIKRVNSAEVVELVSTDGYTVFQVPKQVDVTMRDANGKLDLQRFVNG